MNQSVKRLVLSVGIAAAATLAWAAGNQGASAEDLVGIVRTMEKGSLNAQEKEALLLMREEEKLARDVYLALWRKWNVPVFQNIAQSEQTHMDAVKFLLDRYGLADPVGTKGPGMFVSKDFADLYKALVDQGGRSVKDAMAVGAMVEELDLRDLMEDLEMLEAKDVAVLWQNLAKASRNHLRSFATQYGRLGGTWKAVHLDPAMLRAILDSDRETAAILDPDYAFGRP